MRNCSLSTRAVFVFNIITVLVLVTYLVDLEKKIVSAKSNGYYDAIPHNSPIQTEGLIKFMTVTQFLKFLYWLDSGHVPPHLSRLIVLYNRVPKTGSTSFMGLAYDLCFKNKFKVLHVNITKNSHVMSLSDQMRFTWNVSHWDLKQPAFYHGHFAHLDFVKFGFPSPIYVNVIRKPLDRMISYYYFLRYGDDFRPHLVRKKQGNKMTFDDCVKEGLAECDPVNLWLQVPFFCGHHADCWIPGSSWAFEQAKTNLVNKYLLVGVTEQMEEFVAILEATLPMYFRGALQLYRQGSKSHLRKTNIKVPPKPETVERFKNSTVWQLENQFYEFALRQFEAVKTRTLNPDASDKGQQFFYEKIRPKI